MTTSTSAGASTSSTKKRSALFSKLPDATAIGHGYRVRKTSLTDPPEPFDPATTTTSTKTSFNVFDRYCPGANWPRLDSRPDVAGVEYVEFVGTDERELSIGLAPVPESLDRDGMAQLRKKINDCGTITDEQGFAVSTDEMRADEIQGIGDYGIDIHWTSSMAMKNGGASPMGGLSSRTYLFVVNDTLVAVEAGGGFDLDELHTVTGDDDLVPDVAKITAERLKG